jgi:hypothetical protein
LIACYRPYTNWIAAFASKRTVARLARPESTVAEQQTFSMLSPVEQALVRALVAALVRELRGESKREDAA